MTLRLIVGQGIKHTELKSAGAYEQVLMLRMYVHQAGSDLREESGSDRRIINERARAARRAYFSPQYQLCLPIQSLLFENILKAVSVGCKYALHHHLAFRDTALAGIGTGSEQQGQGSEQDALAGTRFAGNNREAGAERYVKCVYQRVVAYVQSLEHDLIWIPRGYVFSRGVPSRWGKYP